IVQHLIPTDALPFAFAAFTGTLQGIKNAIGIGNLVERRRPFGAIASAAPGILGIAFELLDCSRLFVDVRQQPARRFAFEACRRHQLVMALLALRPGLRIELSPIIPAFLWREGGEMDTRRSGVAFPY